MLSLFKIQKKGILGMDLSGTQLKLIELGGSREEPVVEHYALVEVPQEVYSENKLHDPEKLGQLLQQIYKRNQLARKHVALALPAGLVNTKECDILEGLRPSEQLEEVQKEAANIVPMDLEELYIDYKEIGPAASEGQVRVAFAVCKKEHVEERVSALEIAGLIAKVVDTDNNAMLHVIDAIVRYQKPELLEKMSMVVDLGFDVTQYIVYKNEKIVWTQEHHIGGRSLLDSVRSLYGGDYATARKMLIDVERTMADHPRFEADVILPFVDSLALEISHHLEVFGESGVGFGVDHIFLSGMAVFLPDIEDAVSNRVNITTTIANPLGHCVLGNKIVAQQLLDDAPQMMVAVGMALRNFE
jgi:type IV pilus assembly protein PilM